VAEVTLEIGGRSYAIACRDGEETHLIGLSKLVDAKAQDASRAMGAMTENRHLLVTALLLADSFKEQAVHPGTHGRRRRSRRRGDRAACRTYGKARRDA